MIGDLQAGHTAIYSVLKAVTAITDRIGGAVNPRIYSEIAQQGVEFPLILIQTLPSREDSKTATGMERIFANGNFRVVAVARARRYENALKTAIDAAIDQQSYVVGDNRVMSISRTREVLRMPPPGSDGIQYAWAGGDYSVTIR
jgi:hypothetical protein